jgi:hypothetical protein
MIATLWISVDDIQIALSGLRATVFGSWGLLDGE